MGRSSLEPIGYSINRNNETWYFNIGDDVYLKTNNVWRKFKLSRITKAGVPVNIVSGPVTSKIDLDNWEVIIESISTDPFMPVIRKLSSPYQIFSLQEIRNDRIDEIVKVQS